MIPIKYGIGYLYVGVYSVDGFIYILFFLKK